MARIRCYACGFHCETAYKAGVPEGPECESFDIELAVFVWELPIDDPYWTAAEAEAPRRAKAGYGRLQ